jgi:Uma2 family endonuclease
VGKVLNRRPSDLLSYEEFLATDMENHYVEWVGGRIVEKATVDRDHQEILGFLRMLLGIFADEKKLGTVRSCTFQMKIARDFPGRSPDLMFISKRHKKRLTRMFVDGPADLAVEVSMPESRVINRGEKFFEYEKGGVREYWLIDPQRKQAEFYLLDKRGIYQLMSLDGDGIFHSAVLKGVWIKVAWLWQSPLPSEISIMREWGLI